MHLAFGYLLLETVLGGSRKDWRPELGGRRLGNLGEACISNPEASPDAFWILDSENLGAFKPSLK